MQRLAHRHGHHDGTKRFDDRSKLTDALTVRTPTPAYVERVTHLEHVTTIERSWRSNPIDRTPQCVDDSLDTVCLRLTLDRSRSGDDGDVAVHDHGVFHEDRVRAVRSGRHLDNIPLVLAQHLDVPLPLTSGKLDVDRRPFDVCHQPISETRTRGTHECNGQRHTTHRRAPEEQARPEGGRVTGTDRSGFVHGNSKYQHRSVGVVSLEAVEAPEVVTSDWIDEQLAPTYERWGLRPGLLAELAGIKERRWWPEGVTFDQAAAKAGRAAIDASGVDPDRIGMLISTSVCKHHLEPSVACAVHHQLGLSTSCTNFDLANACLGFVNAMHLASTAIDAGFIDYALIVDGEGSRHTQLATISRLQRDDALVTDVFDEFASLTLGSGAAAMVLGRLDEHPDAHRVVGGVARAGTEHHTLCIGDLDKMTTDTKRLLEAGLDLAHAAWKDAEADFDWVNGMDRYIVHQVSSVHTRLITERLGIDPQKVPLTYPHYGNVGPAAIPITLAGVAPELQRGDRVLCMGIGSGLNTSFTELVW